MNTELPLKVQLTAKADGTIDQILYNNKPIRDFAALRSQVVSFLGNDQAIKETAEVELECDYHLHYRYVIDAITHVSGYVTEDGQSTSRIGREDQVLAAEATGREMTNDRSTNDQWTALWSWSWSLVIRAGTSSIAPRPDFMRGWYC